MKAGKIRKIPYRIPGTNRIVWGVVLAESEGLSLLFVRNPDKGASDHLTIAAENGEHVFESASVSTFPIKRPQLLAATAKLAFLGGAMTDEEISDILNSEGM